MKEENGFLDDQGDETLVEKCLDIVGIGGCYDDAPEWLVILIKKLLSDARIREALLHDE